MLGTFEDHHMTVEYLADETAAVLKGASKKRRIGVTIRPSIAATPRSLSHFPTPIDTLT